MKPISVLGRGCFGIVSFTKHFEKDIFYALKSVQKKTICEYNLQEQIRSEEQILQSIDHPFIVKLLKTHTDNFRFYFLMEFVEGTDFFSAIRHIGLLKSEEAKFYVAQILFILDFLHENNVVFRDLKPENMMVDKQGYLKLIDFGSSKILKDQKRTFTVCGTP